jgi:hypothetical protein
VFHFEVLFSDEESGGGRLRIARGKEDVKVKAFFVEYRMILGR